VLCGQEKKGELYRVLCRAAVELPAVRPLERNPQLEARCQKLRREQVCHSDLFPGLWIRIRINLSRWIPTKIEKIKEFSCFEMLDVLL
jgi:hypothetical protein